MGGGGEMFKLWLGATTETGQRNEEGEQLPVALVSSGAMASTDSSTGKCFSVEGTASRRQHLSAFPE